jgi:hypothetical protein
MKKTVKKKLTLSKETITSLEKLVEVAGAAYSDLWPQTTCMAPA